ncbi:hypothetical protein Tco_1150871, partial [Tanacetum coccineum]
NFIDHVPPLGFWASLRNQTDVEFLNLLNVNTAQHVCMVSELHLCYEHEIEVKEKFKKNFVKSAETIQQRDAYIVSLESRLEGAEGEAAKVLQLDSECRDMWSKVVGEAKLKEEFMAMRDAGIQRLEERNAELDTCFSEVNYQVDSKLCPYMLTAITGCGWMIGQWFCSVLLYDGLTVRVEHAKVRREIARSLRPMIREIKASMRGRWFTHGMGCLEILLGPDLEVFRACAQRYRNASSSLVVAEPVVASGLHTGSLAPTVEVKSNASSLAVGVTPVNSITVSDYQLSDVSILRDIAINDNLQNQTSMENVVHDNMFDTTLLDRVGMITYPVRVVLEFVVVEPILIMMLPAADYFIEAFTYLLVTFACHHLWLHVSSRMGSG